jgi:F0F1-type ATP synthase membrane subunit c/vacuolar-type H+-ATPase subunit K
MFVSAVLVGLAMLGSGLGNSFHSVGALLESVSAGL